MAGVDDGLVCGDEVAVFGDREGAFEAEFGLGLRDEAGEAEESLLEGVFFGDVHVGFFAFAAGWEVSGCMTRGVRRGGQTQ